jgi:MFS family permease
MSLTNKHRMSYSPLTSQALSAPPYLFSFVVVIFTTYLSDRRRARSPYLIFHSALGTFGYFLLALSGYLRWPPLARYIGVFPAAAGFFSAVALTITWSMDNRHAAEGKGASVTLLNIVGQLGPLVGTRLYPDDDAPYYVKGMGICAIFMLLVGILAFGLRVLLKRENESSKEDMYERVAESEDIVEARSGDSQIRRSEVTNIL